MVCGVRSIIGGRTNLEIDLMAKLPPDTLTTIFNLQRRLVELIDEAKAAEYNLFEEYGETQETLFPNSNNSKMGQKG